VREQDDLRGGAEDLEFGAFRSSPDAPEDPEDPDAYRVELDDFAGPLDLLLYLVRKEEVEVEALPLARVTEQYLAFLDRLGEVDLERAGDYLVMAAQLVALKARSLLPDAEADTEDELEPAFDRSHLVEELLEYRKLKEEARFLSELEDVATLRHARAEPRHIREVPLRHVDLWDLVTAFQRLERQVAARPGETVVEADDTPLAVYVEALRGRLEGAPDGVPFSALFGEAPRKAQLVATFLALLELIRLGEARAHQENPFSEIRVHAHDGPPPLDEDDGADA
jgi:segregation and condensation protein A